MNPEKAQSAALDTENFFNESNEPESLGKEKAALKEFLSSAEEVKAKVVCITSGGTTVPLEKNTVRFLDNFSSGNRGAKTAEEFLKSGYYVIFLSRAKSAAPFARTFQNFLAPTFDLTFMKYLTKSPDGNLTIDLGSLKEEPRASILAAQSDFAECENRLLNIPFVTLEEYLHKLRAIAEVIGKKRALFILAAAVSDFYIPEKQMITHKIQSRSGPLQLELEQVPKTLGVLRTSWAPSAMFVSFKLETDHTILLKKAKASIEKYGMHCVVANELHSRYEELVLVTAEEEIEISRGQSKDIESKMAAALMKMFDAFE